MMKIKFSSHPAAACYMMQDEEGARALISYSTLVVTIDNEGWLHVTGLYSRTTIKHIGWFMREIGLTYQHAKALYEKHQDMNIYTGEVRGN